MITSTFTRPAFAVGALFNLGNLAVVGFLVIRQTQGRRLVEAPTAEATTA